MPQFDFRVIRLPRWAVVLIAALAVALGVALAMLAVGILLVLIPVVLVSGAVGALLGRGSVGSRGRERRSVEVIETDYVVVREESQPDRKTASLREPGNREGDRRG